MEITAESVLGKKKSEPINKTIPLRQEHSTKKRSCQAEIPVKTNCKKIILQAFHYFPWHANVGSSSL